MADRHPESSHQLARALDGRLRRLGALVVRVAIESGGPLGRVAAEELRARPDSSLATELAKLIPASTLALGELALEATRQRMAHEKSEGASPLSIAVGFYNVALRESSLGRNVDALRSMNKAIEVFESWIAEDAARLDESHATFYNGLATARAAVGDLEGGLAAIERAIAIRSIHQEEATLQMCSALGMDYHEFSNRLAAVGRHDDALDAAQRAVNFTGRVIAANAVQSSKADHATALATLARRLCARANYVAALDASESALRYQRELYDADEDAHSETLASTLYSSAILLRELARFDDALAAIDESLALRLTQKERLPEAFRESVARALSLRATILRDAGQMSEACNAAQQACTAYAQLGPGQTVSTQIDHAGALLTLANALSDLGRHEDAFSIIDGMLSWLRPLVGTTPDPQGSLVLWISLNTRAAILGELGRDIEALASAVESVAGLIPAAKADPVSYGVLLAGSLNTEACALLRLGHPDKVEEIARQAILILRPPFLASPTRHFDVMRSATAAYISALEARGADEVDEELLGPVLDVFRAMKSFSSKEPRSS